MTNLQLSKEISADENISLDDSSEDDDYTGYNVLSRRKRT